MWEKRWELPYNSNKDNGRKDTIGLANHSKL